MFIPFDGANITPQPKGQPMLMTSEMERKTFYNLHNDRMLKKQNWSKANNISKYHHYVRFLIYSCSPGLYEFSWDETEDSFSEFIFLANESSKFLETHLEVRLDNLKKLTFKISSKIRIRHVLWIGIGTLLLANHFLRKFSRKYHPDIIEAIVVSDT
jgi:hypothetical protein